MKRMVLALVGMSLVGASGAAAQQQTRDQMEQQLRELRQQVQELQRMLRERDDGSFTPRVMPKVLTVPPGTSRLFVSDNKPKLGVSIAMDRNPATDSIGAALSDVSSGGPAEDAGIRAGDIITKYNGETLTGRYPAADDDQSEPGAKLIDLASHLKQGDTVKLEYRRGGETKTASVVARRLSDSFGYSYSFGDGAPFTFRKFTPGEGAMDPGAFLRSFAFTIGEPWLDMETATVGPELGEYFGTTKGLLVLRAPRDSSLSLKAGDVILTADGRDVTSASQLYRVLRSYDPGETVKLDVMRQKRRITVTAKVPERDGTLPGRTRKPEDRRGTEG